MIKYESCSARGVMPFNQLIERLHRWANKRSIEGRSAAIDQTAPEAEKNTKKIQPNKALDKVNNAIQNEGPSNQLLFQKAEILSHKRDLHQANQLLNKLAITKNFIRTANAAKRLLLRTDQLPDRTASDNTEQLIKNLRKCAATYDQQLINIPKTKRGNSEYDITQFVRREAHRARTNELPKLSLDLIELTLQAGNKSPWLRHDKAMTLNIMGQNAEALKIFNDLAAESKGEKITNSITKNTENITNRPNRYRSKRNYHLAKQAIAMTRSQSLEVQFIPEIEKIKPKDKIKPLILKDARSALEDNPDASLLLTNLILSYFPGDLAALQLKGEALASLKESDKAIQIWKKLSHSENAKVAAKASESIGQIIAQKAKAISTKKSPKSAIFYYIQQNFKHDLSPTLNREVKEILIQMNSSGSDSSDPELLKQHYQLQLNTLVIEHFEMLWRDKGLLNPSGSAQKPDAIRKTAPEAG